MTQVPEEDELKSEGIYLFNFISKLNK